MHYNRSSIASTLNPTSNSLHSELAINENSEARVLPRQTRPTSSEEFSYLSDEDRILYDQQDPEKKPSLAGFNLNGGKMGTYGMPIGVPVPLTLPHDVWVETIRSAESLTGAVAAGTAPLPSRRELTFLSELESAASFCERPSTHRLHSAFFADQRSIEHLYPLFSPSKPQGFADILIPSYYHYSPRAEFVYESDYKSGRNPTPADIPWNQKANKMYWHGKLTRGADTPPGHTSSFQKQRLVKLVSNDTESAASLTSTAHKQGETDPSWRSETSRVLVSLNVTSENLLSVSAPATVVDPLMLDIAMACDPKAGECHEPPQAGISHPTTRTIERMLEGQNDLRSR
ncbi:capsule-associated protein CAP1 [Puccinia graminis f. sp. tritici]|uniref:Capsule-associated protein CAP1 n=1 Tax=Puccinia graminis f. sp. tritici TaxID=56615 RepID=A0A5B0QX82_PUCGR|nr:capsule-associated protein CAP1 [Puccinia graminis f. sp. tritici]